MWVNQYPISHTKVFKTVSAASLFSHITFKHKTVRVETGQLDKPHQRYRIQCLPKDSMLVSFNIPNLS